MHADDKPRFFALLVGMAELYRRTFSETALALYWAALVDYPWERIEPAIAAHLRHPDAGAYCPTPADIVRQLTGGSTADRAALAWAKVERATRIVGAYASVVFDDPVIMMALADLGGWPSLCHTALEELPFRARDFKALYAAYAVQPPASYPRALPGLSAQHNEAQGYAAPLPVLIGNEHAALAVWRGGQDVARLTAPVRESPALLTAIAEESPPAARGPAAPDPATAAAAARQSPADLRALLPSSTPSPAPAPRHPTPSGPAPDEQDRLLAAARARYQPVENEPPVWTPPAEETAA